MIEWLYEAGIGENRAALVARGRILVAEIELPGTGPRVGAVIAGRLVHPGLGTVALADGTIAVLARPARGLTEGAALNVEIIRQAIREAGRDKPAKAVPAAPDAPLSDGPDLLARISASGHAVRHPPPHGPDELEAAGWSEVIEEALSGDLPFLGGRLRLAVTPAMTLFDVDGDPPLDRLAVAAATAVGEAIVRHGIGGSIGIDFPTLAGRAPRQAVAAALDAALPQPFERTAVNGFGFLQIVRPRLRASLPELLRGNRGGAAARAALRAAERLLPPGPHHHIVSEGAARWLAANPELVEALNRRAGLMHSFASAGEEMRKGYDGED